MEKYIELSEKAYDILREARKAAIEYITRMLKKHGGKIDFDFNYDRENICVMYDGGNHPEYASNCFSTVYSVFEKEGELYLNIEDCSAYDFDSMGTDDIITVADAIHDSADQRLDEEKEEE